MTILSLSYRQGKNKTELETSILSPNQTRASTYLLLHHQHVRKVVSETMEEVWKDISLTISDEVDMSHRHRHQHPMILKDFFGKDLSTSAAVSSLGAAASPSPPPTMLTLSAAARGGHHVEQHQYFGSTTFLLQSPRNYHHNLNDQLLHSNNCYQQPISHVSSLNSPPVVEDSAINSGKKRTLSQDVDRRRHVRMVKNRESAARSRARKQAYRKELELELAHLMEENARLRETQHQMEIAAAAKASSSQRMKKKKSLHRSSTAPF